MRKSESNIRPKIKEYLQGGILAHKNIIELTNEDGELYYRYDEKLFDINCNREEIELWLQS